MSELIKSCLNYTGGKYKLLPQILPLFPEDINTFVDLFCGGCNVAVNVDAKNIICNDIEPHVIDFYKNVSQLTGEVAKDKILEIVDKYSLSKTNQEGFLECRRDYNTNQTWDMFYAVVSHAFNYQIRYNKNGEYNMPFGKDRSSFNPSLQKKFVEFIDTLYEKNIIFTNKDFASMKIDKLGSQDFVYADPPYLITCASYNEQDGWNEEKERQLLELLDRLDSKGIKFALSNVLYHKGKTNDILVEWCEKYNVHHLNHTYSNCSYHGNKGSSDEVLICNY